ncbi:MAG: hypothetical protein IKM43_04365 [Clostridia bacterium]|nr:hypothetical protein [Clostridia bacterium]
MKKIKNVNLINILTVMIALVCLLMPALGWTGAWFTATGYKAEFGYVTVGSMPIYLYQDKQVNSQTVKTKIDSNPVGNDTPSYLELSSQIQPDVLVNVNTLYVQNDDAGTASYYIRFKFELFANGRNDTPVADSSVITFAGASSFTKNGQYYVSNTPIASGQYLTMFTGFTVPYACFVDSNGQPKFNAETVKIIITIEGSTTTQF